MCSSGKLSQYRCLAGKKFIFCKKKMRKSKHLGVNALLRKSMNL